MQEDYALNDGPKVVRVITNLIASLPRDPGGRIQASDDEIISLIVANTDPSDRQEAAGERLDRIARQKISQAGLPQQVSVNYPQALREARRDYPELGAMYTDGSVSIQGLVDLLPKGLQLLRPDEYRA